LADCVEKVGVQIGCREGEALFADDSNAAHGEPAVRSGRWCDLGLCRNGQFGELPQVLGGGGQQELVLGSARAT